MLLLFAIGLELNPKRLRAMRKPILGLGAAQVVISAALLAAIGVAAGLDLPVAAVAAMGLSLSSTAIVLQTLKDSQLAAFP